MPRDTDTAEAVEPGAALPAEEDFPVVELRRRAARLMGRARSAAKAEAARRNGRLGGWPKGRPRSEETKRRISRSRRKPSAQGTGA